MPSGVPSARPRARTLAPFERRTPRGCGRALEENTETLADDDANAIDDAKVDPSAKGRAREGGGRGGRGNASRR